MLKKLKERNIQFAIICIICLSILAGQLAYLTVAKGDELYAESLKKQRVELKLKGTRGIIVDRYGIPVATNRQIYSVQLDRQQLPSDHEELNNVILRMLEIIYRNGDQDKLINTIPIEIDSQSGQYYYIWEDEDQEVQERKYERWSQDIGVEDKLSAEDMVEYLRKERYKISNEIDDEMALGIISVRLNIYMKRYTQYEPIPIAQDVSDETVVQLETFASEIPGVQTLVDSGRYYPMGEAMSQIVGYLGSISKSQMDEYIEQGYDISTDKIGQKGVEAYAEQWLTGSKKEKQGKLIAEKDSFGKIVRVLEEIPPQNGDDVVLTIDSQLQMSINNILKEEIEKMREGLPPYDGDNIAPNAETGAAVVLDVDTGEILALVSYPSFDPNSPTKEGEQFSLAFQGNIMPGSVYKMLIGIAGLEEGAVTLNERIYDSVRYTKYDKDGPRCWSSRGHGWENYVDALKHSCNYYFYEVADRLGVEKINKWSKLFGLNGETGIEILDPEADKNIIPSEETRFRANRRNMKNHIIRIMKKYGYLKEDLGINDLTDKQEELIDKLIDYPLSEDRSMEAGLKEVLAIAELLENAGYTNDVNKVASEIRSEVLVPYKRWNPSFTIMAGIGQGDVAVSPLSMARYIAAIANGGKVLQTRVLKGIVGSDGQVIKETQPKVIRDLDLNQEHLDATLEGMWKVVNDPNSSRGEYDGGGTAVSHFRDMDSSITLAGKTGTAQIDNNEINNNAWFVAVTPYENPEIAVVVAVPKGRTSGNAAPIARRIIEEYYRLKEQRRANEVPQPYELQQ